MDRHRNLALSMTSLSTSHTRNNFGYAKAILFGEHSVVYGYKAVVCSLGKGASAEVKRERPPKGAARYSFRGIDTDFLVQENDHSSIAVAYAALFSLLNVAPLSLDINLDIPTGAGLGSSAAIGVASARAIVGHEEINEDLIAPAVAAFEKVFHSNPSGVDQAAATHRGLFSYDKKEGLERIDNCELHLVIAKVSERAPTHEIVEAFAAHKEKDPDLFRRVLEEMGEIAVQGIAAIKTGNDVEIGHLMLENQRLLKCMEMSSDALDFTCKLAMEKGALGAKLTGAGRGGCMIALVEKNNIDVEKALKSQGYWTKRTLISAVQE